MKKTAILSLLALMIITSCGTLIFVEVECRDFELNFEKYWFTDALQEEVVFVDTYDNEKTYTIKSQKAYHTTKYDSDTGCGCSDYSIQKLINGTDTIALIKDSFYQYDNDADIIEEICFASSEGRIWLNQDNKSYTEDQLIGDVLVEDCILYSKEINTDDTSQEVAAFLSENLGIIRFQDENGTIWTRKNLKENEALTIESFDVEENTCGQD